MNSAKKFLCIILSFLSLTSCLITDSVSSIHVEILKPGIFVLPDSTNRVAIFNRDIHKAETDIFEFSQGLKIISDSATKYNTLSNECVDALTEYLKKEDYFIGVSNYRDSLKCTPEEMQTYSESGKLFEKTNSDVCIFLDYFHFSHSSLDNYVNLFYTRARLSWTVAFKNDTIAYLYNQIDTLVFNHPESPDYRNKKLDTRKLATDAAHYLGNSFGSKIIPSWIEVERMYYKSSDPEMRKAVKYAKNNDWLKAAEVWSKETKNKKRLIAAKATYNMALACEMEGKPDAGIDWLVKSYSILNKNNEDHKANCKRYINILATRKREMKLLEKQVRITGDDGEISGLQ